MFSCIRSFFANGYYSYNTTAGKSYCCTCGQNCQNSSAFHNHLSLLSIIKGGAGAPPSKACLKRLSAKYTTKRGMQIVRIIFQTLVHFL
ncbi:DUF6783 domain-containing protein [Blautia faecis]|uniref:DUF6783 domain-containing protein n=1 Tax=Blautia faecis TaxID=871665 RepID=UPI003A7F45AD